MKHEIVEKDGRFQGIVYLEDGRRVPVVDIHPQKRFLELSTIEVSANGRLISGTGEMSAADLLRMAECLKEAAAFMAMISETVTCQPDPTRLPENVELLESA